MIDDHEAASSVVLSPKRMKKLPLVLLLFSKAPNTEKLFENMQMEEEAFFLAAFSMLCFASIRLKKVFFCVIPTAKSKAHNMFFSYFYAYYHLRRQ